MQTSQYTYKYGNHHGPVDSMTQTTPKLFQMGKCVYIWEEWIRGTIIKETDTV